MRRAVVIGANGQDGSYLAEHLVESGWHVFGLGRQASSRFVLEGTRFSYRPIDLSDDRCDLGKLLTELAPHRIYHLAAVHGASGFAYETTWRDALRVNVESVHAALEYIRLAAPQTRLLYASSLKVFGPHPPAIVHEGLPRLSTCLYSITKNASGDLIDYYRKHHRVRATSLFLLNHESPRRAPHFFLPRVTGALAKALRGERSAASVRTLDFTCDWGSSREFMQLGCRLLECDHNDDYVMASGKTWTGRAFVIALFEAAGLDWRDHIHVESHETAAPPLFQADLSRMQRVLGEAPRLSAMDVARWILTVCHDIELPDGRCGGAGER